MIEQFMSFYRFNGWANQRILDAIKELPQSELHRDLGGSFPSLHDAMLHLFWVELLFLRRWRGLSTSDISEPPKMDTLDLMQAAWQELERDREQYLSGLTDSDLLQVIRYIDTRGRQLSSVLWQSLFHLINHSSFHRGQAVSKLRQLGRVPPSTDFVMFCRE